jgi:serine/threonine protein kinase
LEQFAEFSNFPVQVTLLEHAEGTMDELLEDEDEEDETLSTTKEARWSAWLFQVIVALTEAQHYFGFVHNDLHSNNVMWSGTGRTHLYYRVHKGKDTFLMKVPTYGRIMKIIDFGRASYHLPDPAGFIISDAFFPGNDAAEQYNCEPFYDEKEGKRVEPNRSFDLARLSISMIETLYQERPPAVQPTRIMSKEPGKLYSETVSPVYNLLWEWLQDDEGCNILRLPDGEERYPDFDLYKALAADVHRAIPSKQVEKPMFSAYRCDASDLPSEEPVYDVHL